MTKPEITKALLIAESDADLSHVDHYILDNFATPGFQTVYVKLEVVARMLRDFRFWNGTWDMESINNFAPCLKKSVKIIG